MTDLLRPDFKTQEGANTFIWFLYGGMEERVRPNMDFDPETIIKDWNRAVKYAQEVEEAGDE